MEIIKTNLNKIAEIAWILSVASMQGKLNVSGEYKWAFPNNQFWSLRDRALSIFSSGNSIKDPDVIAFIQDINAVEFLKDPWIVEKYEELFVNWIKSGNRYRLENLDLFKHVTFSAGMQESFLHFYFLNRNKRFRIFRGEYWWHMDVWTALDLNWCFIEDDDIKENDVIICSYPFALSGTKHQLLDQVLDHCDQVGAEVLMDFIYIQNSNNVVNIDLSRDCIKQITFSLSKTFPVQSAKIALRMSKNKIQDALQISHDENISNRLSAGIGYKLMENFPVDYMVNKYLNKQIYWCNELGLYQSPVVHFANGEEYNKVLTKLDIKWCSPFNEQKNRYNLGMLFENEPLLTQLGLCTFN